MPSSDADRATALIMVITELAQNAIEHAFDRTQGCVTIRAERSARFLDVVVHDDGRGLPAVRPAGPPPRTATGFSDRDRRRASAGV